jgi:hypothetical protein
MINYTDHNSIGFAGAGWNSDIVIVDSLTSSGLIS